MKFVIHDTPSKKSNQSDNVGYHEPSERALHKIVTNTLKHYQFNENYTADTIMRLYSDHDLIKYASVATNNADPKELNTFIDLGEYPIAKVFNKKKKSEINDLEVQSETSSQRPPNAKKQKKEKYSDLSFLPPRPNKYLDVITYSECSPNFEIREDQISEETLALSDADRNEFIITVTQINKVLKPLRGKVATFDRFILFYLIFGLILAAVLGVICAFFLHYVISIVIGLFYFIILGTFVYLTKKRSSMLIKKAHLCLALFLHVENNRYYKKKNIVIRPGYMAKWLEIVYLAPLIKKEEHMARVRDLKSFK